jgi:hypothetical protein
MKKKNFLLIAVLITIIVSFVGCDRELDKPPIDTVNPNLILTIADINQIYADSGNNYVFTKDYMLYATVVMDDGTGNIYKEAYLQDTSGGINLYRLTYAESLFEGDYIRLNLNGVQIVYYSGKMELVFDNVDSEQSIVVQAKGRHIQPVDVTIAELMAGDYNCQLVNLKDVQFKDSDLAFTYANKNGSSNTNRNIMDCSGQSMIVRTSDYSTFAGDTVAQGKGDMVGIATKYVYSGGDVAWQLLIRSVDEVSLDSARCGE